MVFGKHITDDFWNKKKAKHMGCSECGSEYMCNCDVGASKKKDVIYTKKQLEKMYKSKGSKSDIVCPKCGDDMHLYRNFLHCLGCGYWEGEEHAYDKLLSEGKGG